MKEEHKKKNIQMEDHTMKDKKEIVLGTDIFTGERCVYDKENMQKYLVLGHPR